MNEPTSPGPEGGVELERVGSPGRSKGSRAALLAVAGIVSALVIAIGLAQAYPPASPSAPEPPPAEVASPAAAVVSSPASTLAPADPSAPVAAAPRLRAADLVTGVRDGSLDGDLVYADAALTVGCHVATTSPCPSPALSIAGLALDVVPGIPGTAVGAPPDRAVLVLAIRDGRLVYLGPLLVHPDPPPPLSRISGAGAGSATPWGPATAALTDVRGWLVLAGPCVIPPSAFQHCPRRPFIADDAPLANGEPRTPAGAFVDLASDAWGIDPPFDPVLGGPFLVRPVVPVDAGDPAWELVARYDPSHSVRVVIP